LKASSKELNGRGYGTWTAFITIAPDEKEEREGLAVVRRIRERHKRERENNYLEASYSIFHSQPKFYLTILELIDGLLAQLRFLMWAAIYLNPGIQILFRDTN